jgi:hypothetical protein
MKKNGFTPLLIVLVIAVLAVIGYFGYKYFQTTSPSSPSDIITPAIPSAEETSDMTTNWQIYINMSFNYSIKYPSDLVPVWGVEEPSGDESASEKNPSTTSNMSLVHSVTDPLSDSVFSVMVSGASKTLEEQMKINNDYNNGLTYSKKALNSLPAIYASSSDGNQYYTLIHNDLKYDIYATGSDASQILSTFKFTK